MIFSIPVLIFTLISYTLPSLSNPTPPIASSNLHAYRLLPRGDREADNLHIDERFKHLKGKARQDAINKAADEHFAEAAKYHGDSVEGYTARHGHLKQAYAHMLTGSNLSKEQREKIKGYHEHERKMEEKWKKDKRLHLHGDLKKEKDEWTSGKKHLTKEEEKKRLQALGHYHRAKAEYLGDMKYHQYDLYDHTKVGSKNAFAQANAAVTHGSCSGDFAHQAHQIKEIQKKEAKGEELSEDLKDRKDWHLSVIHTCVPGEGEGSVANRKMVMGEKRKGVDLQEFEHDLNNDKHRG